jgi:hypothetical protein
VTIEVSKITCDQYIRYTVADPHDIAVWLSGYYNGKRNNTVLETQEFREHAKKAAEPIRSFTKRPRQRKSGSGSTRLRSVPTRPQSLAETQWCFSWQVPVSDRKSRPVWTRPGPRF